MQLVTRHNPCKRFDSCFSMIQGRFSWELVKRLVECFENIDRISMMGYDQPMIDIAL